MTRYISLIGYPLGHSVSAQFQQAALDYCDLDIEYEVWETDPAQLAAAVGELRLQRNMGANVTIPFKEAVLPMLDVLDPVADEVGAVNAIVNQGEGLAGYNTDVGGFLRALKEDGGFEPAGKTTLVLGAGGAARAVCYALASARISRLTIANRSRDRAEELAEALHDVGNEKGWETDVRWVSTAGPEFAAVISECDLLVNCTPVGMKHSRDEKLSPVPAELLTANALVYDLVYNPSETVLMKAAAGAEARTLGGLPMLVYQGAAAFELWTGKEAPIEVMLEAAKKALA